MSSQSARFLTFHVSRSVQFTFVAAIGVTAGYALLKWVDGGPGEDYPSKTKARKHRKFVPGLLNVGNSCFMNTLLQCLASCPSFMQWLNQFKEITKSDKDHVYMADVLLRILKILTGETEIHGSYFDPSELLQDMGGRGWQISSDEQDAHEFLHAVMTTLLEEYCHHVTKTTRPLEIFEVQELLSRPSFSILQMKSFEATLELDTSPKLNDPPLRGTLACVLRCQECGYQNPIRYDGFDSLSLSLPSGNNITWATEINLVDCLRSFMAPELVRDVICKNCSRLTSEESAQEQEPTDMQEIENSDTETTLQNNNITLNKPEIETSAKGNSNEIPNVTEQSEVELLTDKKSQKISFPKLNFQSPNKNYYNFLKRRMDDFKKTSSNHGNRSAFLPTKRTFLRQLCFGKLPDCLCIHLQRLVWTNGTPMKKMNFVKFPEILDVGSYTNISRVIKPKKSVPKSEFKKSLAEMSPNEMHKMLLMKRQLRSDSLKEEGVAYTPPVSLQGGSQTLLKPNLSSNESQHKALYRLTSVIVHVGDWSFSGHFLAYRRSLDVTEGDTGWVFTSDTFVRKAAAEEVFSCPAYMLFYERIKT